MGRASAVEAPPRAREAELTHALYERHSHQLYGFCYAKLGSREEAEDAVQTTFLNAFRALERGVVPQAESAWLFKIAENVCLSRHRSSFRRRRVEAPSDLEVLQDVVPAREHDGDELVGLERVLEKMPESQRRAILLREWQGLSYREIAEEMELTQAAVETLIFRARRSLAQGLEALDDAPEHESLRRRVRRGADAGGLIAALKTFLGTAAGMKAAATVVAVGSATVIAAAPPSVRHAIAPAHRAPKKPAAAVVVARRAPTASVLLAASATSTQKLQPRHRPTPAPALLAARRTPTPSAHRAAPVETAASVAPPVPAPAPAPPVEAPAAPEPTPPQNDAPPVVVTPAQPVASTPPPAPADAAPAKDKGKDKSKDATPAPPVTPAAGAPGRDKRRDDGDNGHGPKKRDVQAAPANATQSTATTTTSTDTTSTTTTTAQPATTTVQPPATVPAATTPAATTPAPAVPAPAPADQGHRGHGGGRDHKS